MSVGRGMKARSRHGFIYFIRPSGLVGPIKIGFSIRPLVRIQPIQANSPIPLEIIGQTPGSMDDESYLHRCFADQFSHAEWFHFSASLNAAIEGILRDGIQYAYRNLTEKGPDRLWTRKKRSAETRQRMSLALRKSWDSKRERFPHLFRKRER